MSGSFPNIGVPEKDKKSEDYYRRWVESICTNTFTNNWITSYNKLNLLYNFFLEGTASNLTGYLQTAPDGSSMPGIWTSISTVRSRMKGLLGELEERSYQIKARALNTEAVARKLEEKERLRVKRVTQPTRAFVQNRTGIELEKQEYVPQNDRELDEYMDLGWKDKNVLILEGALKWIAKRSNWDEIRKRDLLNVIITNICINRNEIVRGVPKPRAVDPMKFMFDPNSTDDMLSDSTYFGEVDYVPLASAAERYGLSEEQISQAYGEYQSYLGLAANAVAPANEGGINSFGCIPGNAIKWFRMDDGSPRVLVVKAVWRDYKTLAHKYEKNDKYGTEHLQDVSKYDKVKKKDEDKIIHNKIECWRQGTIIGGKFVREWGECPNQPRELSSLEVAECPYQVWIPEFFVGKSVSMVEQQVGVTLLRDIAMYQLQIQMARAVGKVLVFDEAMMPEGMTKETVIRYIKADGVAFVNSKEYQLGTGNMNLFRDYDIGLSESIGQGIQLIEYLDKQADSITGISQERQGQIQGASQTVGTTSISVNQSNLITAPLFRGFERFCSRVLNNQAKLVKIAWAGKEMFAPIIGDVGVDFLKDNIDISLDEFDVVIESLPPSAQDRGKLEQLLMLAVQADVSLLPDAMSIFLEPDTTVAIRKMQRVLKMKDIIRQQQEQNQAAKDAQLQEQQIAAQQQAMQQQAQLQMDLQAQKGQNNIDKTLITSRTKLAGAKIDLLK